MAALILAAGASTRLGQPKQLVLFRGEPLLRRTARLALAAGAEPVLVVIPAQEGTTPCPHETALAGLPATILQNRNATEGMGSSLRLGIAALPPTTQRVLLLVCDQPLLRPEHLRTLLNALGSVAAARYNDRLGVPAVFNRQHFPALADVHGDQGARSLLRSLPVTAVPLPEAALDIDTPEDLLKLETLPLISEDLPPRGDNLIARK